MAMEKIIECVPNFSVSEAKDKKTFDAIIDCFRGVEGVKLLDYSSDADHNRSVVTVIGEPEPLKEVMVTAIGTAVKLIDMTKHVGQHPRMGCVDVVPFIPIRGTTVEEADALAKEVATEAAEKFGQPFFLYEDSAKGLKHSANLATIRKGQFEGMAEKIAADPETWTPDIGPSTIHPTGGATVIGARMPLIAYNINLSTSSVEIAQKIADKIRNIKGGFKYCKAMGVLLENKEDPSKNVAQVSMNLTNYTKTSIYTVFETVRMEARRYGVNVMGSEIIGLVPLQALVDCAAYYLGLNNLEESNCGFETKFTTDQVLETRL
ncbi:glutamate formimidoyltransferase [Blautia stercoris]